MRTAIDRELLGVIFSWLEHPLDTSHAPILADLLLDKNPNFFGPQWHEELCNGTASVVIHQYGLNDPKREGRIPLTLVGSLNKMGTRQYFSGIRYTDVWRTTPVRRLFRQHLLNTFGVTTEGRPTTEEWLNATWEINLTASDKYRFANLKSCFFEAGIEALVNTDAEPLPYVAWPVELNSVYDPHVRSYHGYYRLRNAHPLYAFRMSEHGSRCYRIGTVPNGTVFRLKRRMTNPTEYAMADRFAVPCQPITE